MAEQQLPDVVPVCTTAKLKQESCYPGKEAATIESESNPAVSVGSKPQTWPPDCYGSGEDSSSAGLRFGYQGIIETNTSYMGWGTEPPDLQDGDTSCGSTVVAGSGYQRGPATFDTTHVLRRYRESRVRLSIVDETSKPEIHVDEPSNEVSYHRVPTARFSLDGSGSAARKPVSYRLSLDDRLMNQKNPKHSVDEGSTATTNSKETSPSCSSVLPYVTKSASDTSFSRISRQPSFCSVRSDCGINSGERLMEDGGFSQRLLSRSSSRPLYLSVPPALANWSQNKRRSTLSQLGSLPSFASRVSLTKSISSAGSRYLRFDRSFCEETSNMSHWERQQEASSAPSSSESPMTNGLTLTQRLAFPQLAHAEDLAKDRSRADGFIETESNLNFFAKIITFLVLVFAIVLIVGVLTKLFHTPL